MKMLFIILMLFSFNAFAEVGTAGCAGQWVAHPRYDLSGAHGQVKCDCASCHVGRPTVGTAPLTCQGCHGGGRPAALQKPASHIPVGNFDCSNCHQGGNVVSFNIGSSFDHFPQVAPAGSCRTCHSGAHTSYGARAKPSGHIPTTLSCDSCHSKNSWDSLGFSHVGVLPNTCNTCHGSGTNGATTKPSLHIPTAESCDTCHIGYAGFDNGTLSHSGVTAVARLCADCHTGNKLGAPQKDAQHTNSGNQGLCGTCHVTSTWKCGSLNQPYNFAKYNWRKESCS